MRTVLHYLRPQAGQMALQFLIKISGTVVELLLPSLLSTILDTCALQGDLPGVWRLGGLMLLCALALDRALHAPAIVIYPALLVLEALLLPPLAALVRRIPVLRTLLLGL